MIVTAMFRQLRCRGYWGGKGTSTRKRLFQLLMPFMKPITSDTTPNIVAPKPQSKPCLSIKTGMSNA